MERSCTGRQVVGLLWMLSLLTKLFIILLKLFEGQHRVAP